MTAKKRTAKGKRAAAKPRSADYSQVEGRVSLETLDSVPDDLKLKAYFFRPDGRSLGSVPVRADGTYSHPVPLSKPGDVEVVVAPEADVDKVRKMSESYSRKVAAAEWRVQSGKYVLPTFQILELIWRPWWPKRICVSGHVRKTPGNCPVPFVKVEVFDVDRVFCLWPYVYPLRAKLEPLEVVRVEDLLAGRLAREFEPPVLANPPEPVSANPGLETTAAFASLGPQPEPPDLPVASEALIDTVRIQPEAVKSLSAVTYQSKVALWHLFPRCFYSRQLLCTATTDENGYWHCCFNWWPFQFRFGWLRWDWRPDIIIRVTQVIDGVEKVLYLDPYSKTRWNVNCAHIDIWVDDPDIQCGNGDSQDRPATTQVFFTRIGNDEVYDIDQATGLYEKPPWSNTAYGKTLNVHAQFGDTLSRAQAIPGATAPYHYRLSYSTGGGFTPITRQLKDTRVQKLTLVSESYTLGPKPVGPQAALYEVRDFANFYWYNPDWIGQWVTSSPAAGGIWTKLVPDGTCELRLEIFDSTGALLTSAKIDYRDGTVAPPGPLPQLYPCDLVIEIDNEPPSLAMTFVPTPTPCGVIKASAVPPLNVDVEVDQANGRLYGWRVQYSKGITPGIHVLDSHFDAAGVATPVHELVDGLPMLAGVTTTCAFAVKLYAWANVRNGYGLIWYRELINAIAIERCGTPLVAQRLLGPPVSGQVVYQGSDPAV